MKSCNQFLAIVITFITFIATGPVLSKNEIHDNVNYQPITKQGKKWRIGYYQGGYSDNYYPYISNTIKGLIDLGWIERIEIPVIADKDPKKFWDWLAMNVKSNYVEFPADAFYNSDWNKETRMVTKKTIIDRLNNKKDIDLMIAMGTWAGVDLANNSHNTPIMVMSSSDPISSGIIISNEDSGYDHVFARVDPSRWERQIRIFYKTIGFKKLGVAYEDTTLGRSYASIDMIDSIAKEKQFNIIRCFTKDDVPDKKVAEESVVKCFENLAPQVDAIYVVQQQGINSTTIPKLVTIANRYRIPTFSQRNRSFPSR